MKSLMILHIFFACLLLLIIDDAEAKEKQIKLEDIERDNLAAERRVKQDSTDNYETKLPTLAQHFTPPKMQYGFQPLKSAANYLPPNAPSVYNYKPSHTQAYFLSSAHHPHYNYHQVPQVTEPQEAINHPQTAQSGESNFYTHTFYQSPGTQIQYLPTDQLQPYQNDHQQNAQIQYVVDNSIQQHPQHAHGPHKYFPQQVIYVQTPSASNNIHSIADARGNVQYVMYIPTEYSHATNNGVEYTQGSQLAYQPSTESDAEEVRSHQTQSTAFPRPVFKEQPTSLLDSYVPSILQYQYYKQQQDNANAIKSQSLKLSSPIEVGKGTIVKSRGRSAYGDRIKY